MDYGGPCPVCGSEKCEWEGNFDRKGTVELSCPICGRFRMSMHARDFFDSVDEGDRRKLERYLYETRGETDEQCSRLLSWDSASFGDWPGRVLSIRDAASLYQDDGSPLDKFENTIRRLAAHNVAFGQQFVFPDCRWLVPTMDDEEAMSILAALQREGYLDGDADMGGSADYSLTADGLRFASELSTKARSSSRSVFIAACFNDELKDARDVLCHTVESLGYKPRVVNREPHNALIDVMIYELIRESRFVVADLTCNRQSVYYEVGFAHGLGLEVILTCRVDHLKSTRSDFKRVHFDLSHRNILVWKTCEELAEKLRAHIYQGFGSFVNVTE